MSTFSVNGETRLGGSGGPEVERFACRGGEGAVTASYERVNGGDLLFRFGSDVASYITEAESPLIAATAIASTMFKPLVVSTTWVVVDSFGDEKESTRLMKIIEGVEGFCSRVCSHPGRNGLAEAA
jgi:hypothetical protein